MLLNQTAEYALRAMAYLVTEGDGRRVASEELHTEARIPRHYVSKVMRRLVVAELVTSQRGHGGGFGLAKPAEQIRFIHILDAADYTAQKDHCAFGLGRCNAEAPCALHPAYQELTRRFRQWAMSTTLRDVEEGTAPAPIPIALE